MPSATFHDSTSASKKFQFTGSRTRVPTRVFETTIPLAARVFITSRRTVREIWNRARRSGSGGMLFPGRWTPVRISDPRTRTIWSWLESVRSVASRLTWAWVFIEAIAPEAVTGRSSPQGEAS
jgi:hypothetical protein